MSCHGKGYLTCQSCNGTGIKRGQVNVYRPDDVLGKCTFCGGSGKIPCRRCNGSGKEITYEENAYEPVSGSSGSSGGSSYGSSGSTQSGSNTAAIGIAVVMFFIALLGMKSSFFGSIVWAAVAYGVVWLFTRKVVKSIIKVVICILIIWWIIGTIFG